MSKKRQCAAPAFSISSSPMHPNTAQDDLSHSVKAYAVSVFLAGSPHINGCEFERRGCVDEEWIRLGVQLYKLPK